MNKKPCFLDITQRITKINNENHGRIIIKLKSNDIDAGFLSNDTGGSRFETQREKTADWDKNETQGTI